MARRTTTKTAPKTPREATVFDLTSLAFRHSEGVRKAAKDKNPNPLESAVLDSLDGPLAYDVDSEDAAKKVMGLLRRGAQDNGLGLTMSTMELALNEDGTYTIDFQAKRDKRSRKYTAEDIREWAAGTHWGAVTGPIPKDLREEFKVAHGYAKASTEDLNNQ